MDHPSRGAAAVVLLVSLVVAGCSSGSVPPASPATSPIAPSAPSAVAVSTWDGSVLRMPGLGVSLGPRRLDFSWYAGTTVYPGRDGTDRRRTLHVVRGGRDRALRGSPVVSVDGRWVVTRRSTVRRVVDEDTSIEVERFVRWDLVTGDRRRWVLPATEVRCCDLRGATLLQGVTTSGVAVLLRDEEPFLWDGRRTVRVGTERTYAGTWPLGLAVSPTPAGTRPDGVELLAVGDDLGVRVVARTPSTPQAWAPDGRSYLARERRSFVVGQLRGAVVDEAPLALPAGPWEVSAWESSSVVLLVRRGRASAGETVLRCDADARTCVGIGDQVDARALPVLR